MKTLKCVVFSSWNAPASWLGRNPKHNFFDSGNMVKYIYSSLVGKVNPLGGGDEECLNHLTAVH